MSTITDLETNTNGEDSKGIINTNFDNLNADKLEKSGGTMTGKIDFNTSVSSGLELNNLTTVEIDALTPVNGDMIYNTTDNKVQMYENGLWTDASAAGADASTSVKGVTKMSTAPASASNPIAVGDNDPRVPTTDENEALVGTSGTPSSSNKYVTEDDVVEANTASKIPRRDSNGDLLVATTPTDADAAASKTYVDSIGAKKVGASATAVTVANSDSATDLLDYSIAANELGTSNAVKFMIPVTDLDFGDDSRTLTLRLIYGSTTIASVVVTTSGSVNTNHKGMITGYLIANGAAAQVGGIKLDAGDDVFLISGGSFEKEYYHGFGTGSEDSTGALNISVEAEWSVASASLSLVTGGNIVEITK